MGLAASQSRLLLLTSRKSDLEYRAQMICQRKITLAMQTEQLAVDYSRSVADRVLMFTYKTNTSDAKTMVEVLSYEGLTSTANDNLVGQFRVVTQDGKIVVGYTKNANGDVIPDFPDGTDSSGYNSTTGEYYQAFASLDNDAFFQQALRTGSLLIQQNTGSATAESWEYKSLNGISSISDVLDDDGYLSGETDAQAEAVYSSKTLVIQNQDKMLDLELKQVETQQKACENEIDSVKKIIDKSIERGFKTFA